MGKIVNTVLVYLVLFFLVDKVNTYLFYLEALSSDGKVTLLTSIGFLGGIVHFYFSVEILGRGK